MKMENLGAMPEIMYLRHVDLDAAAEVAVCILLVEDRLVVR